ncbi:hypothetical protein CEXT_511001 [Caerostris extrusa]|uniref:Uncharacterized protein n=1 Tax=Caerostris extrusa TaxID=172846 RepID=A0AAV4XHP8_CAEEX|nr:hypothetical protein CEXT_511001 [Caerostris extrusa]
MPVLTSKKTRFVLIGGRLHGSRKSHDPLIVILPAASDAAPKWRQHRQIGLSSGISFLPRENPIKRPRHNYQKRPLMKT